MCNVNLIRLQEYSGAGSTIAGSTIGDTDSEHPAGKKPLTLQTQRPTASVTEIPGAIEGNKRANKAPDWKNPGRPLKGGSMARDVHVDKQPVVIEASEVGS